MKKFIVCFALVFSVCALRAEDKQKALVIHEWGTFTSLQDEDGDAIAGLNTDDEPVPKFVHRISDKLLVPQQTVSPQNFAQGVPRSHPDVTMRLETPVLYFHPPDGWKSRTVDVHVEFKGGWLTEFYPNAAFIAPGFDADQYPGAAAFGHINPEEYGELSWKGLMLHSNTPGVETKEKVWLAPRDVKAIPVSTPGGESEKFLFYRGVCNADASLRIVRNSADKTLTVSDNPRDLNIKDAATNLRIHAAWLVDVRDDGVCAFKSLGKLEYGKPTRAVTPDSFAAGDYLPKNMTLLRAEMHAALVKEGLFADEANALLNTWEISYFKSPGLRFFYLCPRVDTDYRLPLQISVESKVTRVMMGRIEIVTPEQRALLKQIAAAEFKPDAPSTPAVQALYQKLGRFRNALALNEQKRRPTQALTHFIVINGLWGYGGN